LDNLHKNFILTPFNVLYKFNPELTLKLLYRLKMGQKLDLKNPKLYNEKIQWIKLNDKNPLMPMCCDKFWVREYVKSKGLENILIEQYWNGFDPNQIPYESLPEEFIIKVTHGSSFNIISTNKEKLNKVDVSIKINRWLKSKYLSSYGEWFYGVKKPRIIVEKLLETEDGSQLKDYKIFCFNGVPKFIRVDMNRSGNQERCIYDTHWNEMKGYEIEYKTSTTKVLKPEYLNELLIYAQTLSSDFYHARVDFYILHSKIYFGEITFTSGAGYASIIPKEFEEKMGDWLKLPLN